MENEEAGGVGDGLASELGVQTRHFEERGSERVLTLGDVFDDAWASRSFHSRHGSSVTHLGCNDGSAGYQKPRVREGIDTTSRHK